MNKFSFRSIKIILFAIFLAMVLILLGILYLGPACRATPAADDAPEIPAVVYLTDSDISGSDLSGSDISESDTSSEVTE